MAGMFAAKEFPRAKIGSAFRPALVEETWKFQALRVERAQSRIATNSDWMNWIKDDFPRIDENRGVRFTLAAMGENYGVQEVRQGGAFHAK